MVTLLTTKEARAKLRIDGKEISHVLFDRFVNEGFLDILKRTPDGPRIFLETDVLKLARRLPKIYPPDRIGVINWLKGKRPMNQKKAAKK